MNVIDAHFHWYPPSLMEYLANRVDSPRAVADGADGYVLWFNGGQSSTALDDPMWFDLDLGLAASAAVTGPDTAVVGTVGVISGLVDQLPADEGALVSERYNEEIAETQKRYRGRFFGTAMVPLHDTDTAIRILDHAITDLDLRGVNLGPAAFDGPIDQPRLEPLYARIAELGVPLIIHPTDFVFAPILSGYDGKMQLTIGRLVDASVTTLRLVYSGIMERHPELKILQTHAGGVLPYQAGRIDKNGPKHLSHPPSDFLRRIYVDTVAPQELTISTAVAFYGEDQVVYGTDNPCWSIDAARGVVAGAGLSDEVVRKIMTENIRSIMNLDLRP